MLHSAPNVLEPVCERESELENAVSTCFLHVWERNRDRIKGGEEWTACISKETQKHRHTRWRWMCTRGRDKQNDRRCERWRQRQRGWRRARGHRQHWPPAMRNREIDREESTTDGNERGEREWERRLKNYLHEPEMEGQTGRKEESKQRVHEKEERGKSRIPASGSPIWRWRNRDSQAKKRREGSRQ